MYEVGADEIVGAVASSGFGRRLRAAGARTQVRSTGDSVEYRMVLPRGSAPPIIVRHVEPVQDAAVGGRLGRKIKKGLKKAAQKVAKAKVFKIATKLAGKLGKVLPGPLGMALKLGSKGMDFAVKAAAKGRGPAKKALAAAARSPGGVVLTARSGKKYRVLPV